MDVPLAALANAAQQPALIRPIRLRSRFDGDLPIDVDELAKELAANHSYLISQGHRAAEHLLILAWESTTDFHRDHPLWQFLRHCRNAAAHGGRFTFRGKQPSSPAQWRSVAIDRSLQGTRLFGTKPGNGLLAPGDAVALLWDIEQTFPEMNVPVE